MYFRLDLGLLMKTFLLQAFPYLLRGKYHHFLLQFEQIFYFIRIFNTKRNQSTTCFLLSAISLSFINFYKIMREKHYPKVSSHTIEPASSVENSSFFKTQLFIKATERLTSATGKLTKPYYSFVSSPFCFVRLSSLI